MVVIISVEDPDNTFIVLLRLSVFSALYIVSVTHDRGEAKGYFGVFWRMP